MFQCVFSFAQKPHRGGHLIRGRITSLDLTISQASVVMDGDEAAVVNMDAQDCSPTLREVVLHGGAAVCVQCDFESSGNHSVQLYLMVQQETLDTELQAGTLIVEEALINLSRSVWREARVPPPPCSLHTSAVAANACPYWKDSEYPLFLHQRESVDWMRDIELRNPVEFQYAGNLRITQTWYLDTEHECFTMDPSFRDACLRGGICADGMGRGKTATALRLIVETLTEKFATKRYESNATLIILPLNLVSQWQTELAKFVSPDVRVVWMVQGKDVKNNTMKSLCEDADVVVTTFYFLRTSKSYIELTSKLKSRAALSSWARNPNRVDPILEAISWKRIVVDEMHEVFESHRDLRQLKLFRCNVLWGLTATPSLDTDIAQHLYLLLGREKTHHPNLLSRLISQAVRCNPADAESGSDRNLRLVHLSGEERMHLQAVAPRHVEETIRTCTFVVDDNTTGGVQERFHEFQENRLQRLRARVEGYQCAIRIQERAAEELDGEVQRLAELCVMRDDCGTHTQAEVARLTCDHHHRDLNASKQRLEAERTNLLRHEAFLKHVRERLASSICPICRQHKCTLIAPCSHMFCSACVADKSLCPVCGADFCTGLTKTSDVSGIGTKMSRIGELIISVREPVILFVQWKTMVRGMRTFLKTLGIRVFTLDGNAAQRATTLTDFLADGVLLLCLEEGFAGLHLAHVGHVVFAHAIVGDRQRVEILEKQAIARCVRHGQTRQVQVYSFVVADCEEEVLYRQTH